MILLEQQLTRGLADAACGPGDDVRADHGFLLLSAGHAFAYPGPVSRPPALFTRAKVLPGATRRDLRPQPRGPRAEDRDMGFTPSCRADGGLRPGTRLAAVDEANLTLDHRGQVNVFLIAG